METREAYAKEQMRLLNIQDPGRRWPVEAVAAHWQTTPVTVWRKIRAQKLFAIKVGRQWLVPVAAIFSYEWDHRNM